MPGHTYPTGNPSTPDGNWLDLSGFAQPDKPNKPYAAFDVVVVACSLGGFGALTAILSTLPANFSAPIMIVQHLSPNFPSEYAQVLASRVALPVRWAENNERAEPGTVYIAPPDHHLLIGPSLSLSLSKAPKMHFTRPSADVLFSSAAEHYKAKALGVVLTGMGRDGAIGARQIKENGGSLISQDVTTARAHSMPAAAAATGCVDLVLPLSSIGPALISLVMVRGAARWFTFPLHPANAR